MSRFLKGDNQNYELMSVQPENFESPLANHDRVLGNDRNDILGAPGEVVVRIDYNGGKPETSDHGGTISRMNLGDSFHAPTNGLIGNIAKSSPNADEHDCQPPSPKNDQKPWGTNIAETDQKNLSRVVNSYYLMRALDLEKWDSSQGERLRTRSKKRSKSCDWGLKVDPEARLIENVFERPQPIGMDITKLSTVPDIRREESTNLFPFSKTSDTNVVTNIRSDLSYPDVDIPNFVGENRPSSNPSRQSSSLTASVREQRADRSLDSIQVFECLEGERNASIPVGETSMFSPGVKSILMSDTSFQSKDYNSDSSDEADLRRSSLLSVPFIQTRWRLAHPPPLDGKIESSHLSGLLEDEEDGPLNDADIPESYRKSKWDFRSVLQCIAFFIIMGGLICSLTVPKLKNRPVWSMALWKWDLLVLLLFCGRLVSGWITRLLVLVLERSFLLRKRVLYFVYELRKVVQNCLWFAFGLLVWRLIFESKVERSTNSKVLPYVTKLLSCFLVAALIWLVKIFFVKVLASSFHVSTYFDRIQESLFGQWVVETLSGPPGIEIEQETKLIEELDGLRRSSAKVSDVSMLPKTGAGGGRSGMISLRTKSQRAAREEKSGEEEGISIDDLQRLNKKNVSAWNMKRLINLVRYRGIYTIAHVIDEFASRQDVEIQSEWKARAAARKIFRNVAMPGASYIEKADLLRFMREAEVKRAMAFCEGAMETGMITKNALTNFAVHVFLERRALSLSLNDTNSAISKFHSIINVIASVLILIISFIVLGITTTHFMLLVSSQLVLVIFIFGNTCKTVFEAIVFLFVMHPFDVGDRCVVDGNQMLVEEMNIMSTLFMRYDGEKVWYPNSLLATKHIFNYYRTRDTGDLFNFAIHVSTSVNKIEALKEKIGKYIASKPSHWTPDYNLLVQDIEDNNRMTMQLRMNHTINYHEELERQIRRSELILEVKTMFQELEIRYRLLPQEVQLRDIADLLPALSKNM